jgi:hypothetical protein
MASGLLQKPMMGYGERRQDLPGSLLEAVVAAAGNEQGLSLV